MDFSERNKKVAIARWKNFHKKQLEYLNNSKNHLRARLFGFIAGDGNINLRKNHPYIRCYPDHESLLSGLVKTFEQVYGVKPRVKKLNNYFVASVYSKIAVNDFLNSGIFGTYKWKLPNNLVDSLSKKEWLRSFFDAEATVHNSYIRVGSVNGFGLSQVQDLLQEFNIHSKIYEYTPKNHKWNKNYLLTISRKKDRFLYFSRIGFNHKLKHQKLNAQMLPESHNLVIAPVLNLAK